MSASPALEQAVAVFTELGWPGADPATALSLPLGSPEQQRTAVAGLSRGEWGSFQAVDPSTFGWRSWLGDGIDAGLLALFAIRCGVTAKRAVAILPGSGRLADELVTAVVADRGPEYAAAFVANAERGGGRLWVDATSSLAGVTVRLVHDFALPVPHSLDYLRDWAVYALGAPANEGWLQPRERGGISPEVLAPRFAEHARVAVASGLGVTGPFGGLLPAALERGWISEPEALALATAGLDAAQRPGDRKVWAEFLTGPLALTNEAKRAELLDRADALVSAIATGDAALIEAFGPALITAGDEHTLGEVLQLGLSARTKKARRALLLAAAGRARPSEAAAASAAELIAPIAAGNDAPLARAAARVLEAWGIAETSAEPGAGSSAGAPHGVAALAAAGLGSVAGRAGDSDGSGGSPAPAIRGRWEATPELWSVPRFTLGDTGFDVAAGLDAAAGLAPVPGQDDTARGDTGRGDTEHSDASLESLAAALTEAAAELTGRPEGGPVDPAAERLLALANLVAHRDIAAARTALRGVKPRWVPGLRGVAEWVGGDTPLTLDRPAREDFPGSSPTVYGPVPARDAAVLQRLGEVPVLLSTPTWDDMRIDPADLLDRLARYSAGGFAASEADLFLALLRTDLTRVTGEQLAAFAELLVPVLTQAGTAMPTPAGPAIARYVADPLVPPARALDRTRHWWAPEPLKLPESLTEFPPRLKLDTPYSGLELGVLAAGGVAGGAEGGSDAGAELALEIAHSDDAGLGLQLRQLARSATPLSPGLAVNLIGAQRGFHERAVHDGALAITEAWERGILLPGVADIRLLDWRETPGKLAALAAACVALAEDGMLAVVWPLLDDLVRVSLASTRRLAGTAELVEAIGELLPAVTDAVGRGVAPESALALPGTRGLAAAGGSSRAVQLARAVVGALPDEAAAGAAEGATAGGATAGGATAEAAPGAAAPGAPPQAEAATAARPGAALPGAALPDAALPDMVLPDAEFAQFWPDGRGTATAVDDGATVRASWHDPKASTRLLEIELEFAPERLADPAAGPRRFRTRTSWFYDLEQEGQCGMSEIHTADDAAEPVADAWLRWDVEAGGVRVAEHRNWRDAKNGPLRHEGPVPPLTVGMFAVLIGSLNHDNAHGYTLLAAVRNDLIGAAGVRLAVARLLESADYSPVKLAGIIEAEPDAIATLWPALGESIRVAASASAPPRWLNRVLDAALLRAPALRAAAERGLIPADAAGWPGLADLAERKGSQAALRKARELRVALGVRE